MYSKDQHALADYEIFPQTRIWAVRPSGKVTPARIKVFIDYIETKISATNQQRYGCLKTKLS